MTGDSFHKTQSLLQEGYYGKQETKNYFSANRHNEGV